MIGGVDAEVVRDITLGDQWTAEPDSRRCQRLSSALEPALFLPRVMVLRCGRNRREPVVIVERLLRSLSIGAIPDATNADAFKCGRIVYSAFPFEYTVATLTTLNEPLWKPLARLARQMVAADGMDDSRQLAFGFRRCVSRLPTETESQVLLKLLKDQQSRFSQDDMKPLELAADDPGHPGLNFLMARLRVDLAAWTAVAQFC